MQHCKSLPISCIWNAKVKLRKSNIDCTFLHTYLVLPSKMECNYFWGCNKNDGFVNNLMCYIILNIYAIM